MEVPKLALNDGNHIPVIGLGTSGGFDNEITQAVKDAIDIGYRHVDTAYIYNNEESVGVGINTKIADGTVKRSDIFVTTKLWCTYNRAEVVEGALRKSLSKLGLDYVDLYLIHWPTAFKEHDPLTASGSKKVQYIDYDYVLTWKAMEEVKKKGLAKSIGVSNFTKRQIERILERSETVPAVNQIECHPYYTQTKMVEFCQSKGIQVVGYCPLGAPSRLNDSIDVPNLLEDPRLVEIAKKYSKTSAQIALRWQIQKKLVVIPKTVKKSRIKENFDIFDFEIDQKDMEAITAFNLNKKLILFAKAKEHPEYPFNEEY